MLNRVDHFVIKDCMERNINRSRNCRRVSKVEEQWQNSQKHDGRFNDNGTKLVQSKIRVLGDKRELIGDEQPCDIHYSSR